MSRGQSLGHVRFRWRSVLDLASQTRTCTRPFGHVSGTGPGTWPHQTWLVRHDAGVEKRRTAKRRPEDVIGEWGIRDVTPPSAAEREALAGEYELNPRGGRALPGRIRALGAQAHPSPASLGGPPLYMQ